MQSRTMVSINNPSDTIEVKQWFITRNGWEYYVYQKPDQDGIGYALVLGFENEMGSFSMEELNPKVKDGNGNIITRSHILTIAEGSDLLDIAPADGYQWV